MIESIEIRNFQIHKKTRIEFVPGINIISGTSDNGKSSVIRAFRWVLENRPQGYSFRRWGTPEKAITAVDVVVDSETISRKRGNIKNEYVFEDTVYKALRSDVPDPIKEHLETLSFNIQMQNEKVFLFQDSDSNVAKLINDVSGISIIDDIHKESNKRLRDLNSEEKILKDLIKDKKAQKASYKSFVGLKKSLNALRIKVEDIDTKQESLDDITECLDNYRRLKQKKKRLPNVSGIEESISKLEKKRRILEEKEDSLDDLESFISFMEGINRVDEEDIIKISESIKKAEFLVKSLQKQEESLSVIEEDIDHVEYLISTRKENKIKLKNINDKIKEIKEECDICPVCEKRW